MMTLRKTFYCCPSDIRGPGQGGKQVTVCMMMTQHSSRLKLYARTWSSLKALSRRKEIW